MRINLQQFGTVVNRVENDRGVRKNAVQARRRCQTVHQWHGKIEIIALNAAFSASASAAAPSSASTHESNPAETNASPIICRMRGLSSTIRLSCVGVRDWTRLAYVLLAE